jgi:hypothetical protein
MRSAPVLRAQLWACLNDPDASPDERAAAAVALASGDEGRCEGERIRVAAQGIASPRLRVVLEAAADGRDDDALADALARVEPSRRAR